MSVDRIVAVPSIAFVCASNSPHTLGENLLRSPLLAADNYPLEVVENPPSAARAYNTGLDRTTADVVVFVHHDVYLPLGWNALLLQRIAEVEAVDPDWALLGAFGVAMDNRSYGPIWSSSLNFIAGSMPSAPVAVQSFDELLIVMRRGAGLRFDQRLGGFHMYGTDIVCEARARDLGAYSVALPLVHNDKYKATLGPDFNRAFHYVRRKWTRFLPIHTPVIRIGRAPHDLYKSQWRMWRSRVGRGVLAAPDVRDPRDYARLCGWMDLRPNLACWPGTTDDNAPG